MSGSNTVLGNKSASCLPAIKGRAIYKFNSLNEEVQTPFLGDAELESRIDLLKAEFKKGKRKLNSLMLGDEEISKTKAIKKLRNEIYETEDTEDLK